MVGEDVPRTHVFAADLPCHPNQLKSLLGHNKGEQCIVMVTLPSVYCKSICLLEKKIR